MALQEKAYQTKIEARITPYVSDDAPHLRGLGSLTINDEIAVHNIRVIEGKNGLFTSMPSKTDSKGEYHDIFYPATKEAREAVNRAVILAYNNALDGTRLTNGNQGIAEDYVDSREGMKVSVRENSYGGGNIKAFASVSIDNAFVINGVKVVDGGEKGNFVQMPLSKNKDGELKRDDEGNVRSVVHPITTETREKVVTVVMHRFDEMDKDIGNTKYNDIKHPTHLSINAEDLDKAVQALNDSEIPYHGKISADGNLAITFSNNDHAAVQAVIKSNGVELAEKAKPTTQDLSNFQQTAGREMTTQEREAPAYSADER